MRLNLFNYFIEVGRENTKGFSVAEGSGSNFALPSATTSLEVEGGDYPKVESEIVPGHLTEGEREGESWETVEEREYYYERLMEMREGKRGNL